MSKKIKSYTEFLNESANLFGSHSEYESAVRSDIKKIVDALSRGSKFKSNTEDFEGSLSTFIDIESEFAFYGMRQSDIKSYITDKIHGLKLDHLDTVIWTSYSKRGILSIQFI